MNGRRLEVGARIPLQEMKALAAAAIIGSITILGVFPAWLYAH